MFSEQFGHEVRLEIRGKLVASEAGSSDDAVLATQEITGGEHRITYPAAQRRFAPITMPWSA